MLTPFFPRYTRRTYFYVIFDETFNAAKRHTSTIGTLAAVENNPCSRAASIASWVANWGSFPRRCMMKAFSLSASSSSPDLCVDTPAARRRPMPNIEGRKKIVGVRLGMYSFVVEIFQCESASRWWPFQGKIRRNARGIVLRGVGGGTAGG